jgi:hypothetical protein
MKKLLWLLMLWCLVAEAEVYRWTDEQGRVHFSDRPLDENSQSMEIAPSATHKNLSREQSERERKRRRLLDVYRMDRAQKQAKQAKEQHDRAERQRNCIQARRRYARFNRAGGIYETDERGERVYLEKEQRARFIDDLQQQIDRWCGK